MQEQSAFKKQNSKLSVSSSSRTTMYKAENKVINMRSTTTLLFSSQTSCRVLLIGVVFSILHTAGILVSAYLMTDRILEPDLPEKPQFHVCTEALFCPFYRILTGYSAISVQIVGSGLFRNYMKLLEINMYMCINVNPIV